MNTVMADRRRLGSWADVGWEDPSHVPQWVYTNGRWKDMAIQVNRSRNNKVFRPVSKYFQGFFQNRRSVAWRQNNNGQRFTRGRFNNGENQGNFEKQLKGFSGKWSLDLGNQRTFARVVCLANKETVARVSVSSQQVGNKVNVNLKEASSEKISKIPTDPILSGVSSSQVFGSWVLAQGFGKLCLLPFKETVESTFEYYMGSM
ncbi:uncharacterized protein LOC131043890 [Cryptomeria japonica]|uniref:uncharacterized protein LOC131043890 n=1 Tax=Cryptomeria japonica TaxID=3369 RepID=UPI0027DA59E8|nr:uncharacterized protein LOC131043890 [Cryptomeria japonica]